MSLVRLSDTDDGQRWLRNFVLEDRPAAARLLDALRFVSEDEFRARLKQLLLEVAVEEAALGSVALYPVRPVDPELVYAEPFPDRPYGPLDGSEHIAANIITEVAKTVDLMRPPHAVLALPKLEGLRRQRVRTIVLVDDNLASGSTIRSYLDKWWESRSIRSWRSYGLVKFVVVTYACSTRGKEAVDHHRLGDSLHYVEFGLDFVSMPWTAGERAEVRDVCRRYAKKRSLALGYGGSESLLAVGHTLPNNLPHILWQGKSKSSWVGFFVPGHRRLTPQQQVKLAGYRSPADLDAIAQALNSPELRVGRFAGEIAMMWLLLLLEALRRPPRTDDSILSTFSFTVFDLRHLLNTARVLRLIDDKRRLTDAGHEQLRQARFRSRRVVPLYQGSDEPYYPLSLRGIRAI